MSVKTKPFDIAEYLETEDDISGFLKEVSETGDTSDFIHALGIAAREAGVTRASLYKSLSNDGDARFFG